MTAWMSKIWGSTKLRLINDAGNAWRFWSVRLSFIGFALMGAWSQLPADTRALIPHANIIAMILFGLTFASRMIDQPGARK